jgi:hypothetical protein
MFQYVSFVFHLNQSPAAFVYGKIAVIYSSFVCVLLNIEKLIYGKLFFSAFYAIYFIPFSTSHSRLHRRNMKPRIK